MAKGLSDTQKTILQTIAEMPEGKNIFYYDIIPELKTKLYPQLYEIRPYATLDGIYCWAINPGIDKDKLNNARVVISKSISRLLKRGLISRRVESRRMKHLENNSYGDTWDVYCIYLTDAGKKLMANVVNQRDEVNQYEDAIIVNG